MQHYSRELRSLPIWLLGEYLQEVGAQPVGGWAYQGEGWQAQIVQLEDFVIGSLRVGQVRLDWQGDDRAQQLVWPLIEQKLMRAGG